MCVSELLYLVTIRLKRIRRMSYVTKIRFFFLSVYYAFSFDNDIAQYSALANMCKINSKSISAENDIK